MWGYVPLYRLVVERVYVPDSLSWNILANLCGWIFFFSMIGIWFSPQIRVDLGNLIGLPEYTLQVGPLETSLLNIVLGSPFLALGALIGIISVKKLGIKISSYLKTEKLVTTGIYSKIRHPQYLGGILSHIGISIILMSGYALLYTPLLALQFYLMALIDEQALIKKFGELYIEYKKKVPMFLPISIRRRK